jgi:hypothetical protein
MTAALTSFTVFIGRGGRILGGGWRRGMKVGRNKRLGLFVF